MANPWLYKQVLNFFTNTAEDKVLANQYIPEAIPIGVDPYINSRFFLAAQQAYPIAPTNLPTTPAVQGSFAVGGIKVYGAMDNGKP